MRSQWLLLLCLERIIQLVGASSFSLSRGRGTVAERRASLRQKSSEDPVLDNIPTIPAPDVGIKNDPPVPGLSADSPESIQNVMDYNIAMPTPMPAALNGVYCRGGACQYRVAPPVPTLPPLVTPPPIPIGGNQNSVREFCRGMSCIAGMGVPGSADLASFNLNCAHLFNDVGGGMLGTDTKRSIAEVHDSFTKVCAKRVGILEVGACPVYATTFIGSLSPKVQNPTVGGTVEVCQDTFWWITAFKQAEIDLKVTAAALPKGEALLEGGEGNAFYRFGSGGNGPSSPRGTKWREYAWKHGLKQVPPANPRQLNDDGSFAGALLQVDDEAAAASVSKPLPAGADAPQDTPRGLPKYTSNPDSSAAHVVSIANTKYQIAPGSADGVVGPVEVAGDLFTYCSNQFSEIMMGFAQTAKETIKMTKGWCKWQASVSSWVGKEQEFGHPDWSHRTCTGMETLLGFSLRNELADTQSGLSATQVCKRIFRSIGSVHRTDALVKEAWAASLRGAPSSGVPAANDEEMKKLLQEAQAYANKIFAGMRGQKSAFEGLNNKKMETQAFDIDSIEVAPPPPSPDLPNSDDVATALLALSVERVRQSKRVGITLASRLKPWGKAE